MDEVKRSGTTVDGTAFTSRTVRIDGPDMRTGRRQGGQSMSNQLTSWVRTIVPTLWAALVAWLAKMGLPAEFADTLGGLAGDLIVPAALAGTYALVRWVEPRLPRWLGRLLLGSSRPPAY